MEQCPFCGGQLISCGCGEKHFYPSYIDDINTTVPFAGLPQEVYENGLSDEQAQEWERVLQEKGLIPFILYPNQCCRCGASWPTMFRVPDDEWTKYVSPRQRGKMLCRSCYDWIKGTIDATQKATWVYRFCESPIEVKLLDGFLSTGFVAVSREDEARSKSGQFKAVAFKIRYGLVILQQRSVVAGGKVYRADFSVHCVQDPEIPIAVIEADGHDYHERSKEDAKRDRSRDRALLSAGIHTIRFTGSEIHANAEKCADEAISIAINAAPQSKQNLILQASEAHAKQSRKHRRVG